VQSKLLSIDPFEPTGPDNIHPVDLKEKASKITPILRNFFNKSIQACTIPSQWKLAHKNPKYKKGNKKSPANYRPSSITFETCKIIENIIKSTLTEYLK
ncbi:hypothetical protein CAPTEDRAFT_110752, partial [Capitella teleta]